MNQPYILRSGTEEMPVALPPAGRAVIVSACPWCKGESVCCVSIRMGVFYCFGCNRHGTCQADIEIYDLADLVAEYNALIQEARTRGEL